MPYVEAARATAEVVLAPDAPASAATPEETDKILRWLEQPGVRIVDIVGQWTCPVGGAGAARAELEALTQSAAAKRVGELVSVHVIPRPHVNIDLVLPLGARKSVGSRL